MNRHWTSNSLAASGEKPSTMVAMALFDMFKKQKKLDPKDETYIAAERTDVPLDGFMTRLMAEELPLLDSADRTRVYEILKAYDGPTITSQEELPEEIRRLMDL